MVHMEDGTEFSLAFVVDEVGLRAAIRRLLSNIAAQSEGQPKVNPYRRVRIERELEAADTPVTPLNHLIGQLDLFDEHYYWAMSPDVPLDRYSKTAYSYVYRMGERYALVLGLKPRQGISEETYCRFVESVDSHPGEHLQAAAALFSIRGGRAKKNLVLDWLDFCNGEVASLGRELSQTQETYTRAALFKEMRRLLAEMWAASPEPADLAVVAALCHWPRFRCDFCGRESGNYAAIAVEGPRGGSYLVCSAECYRGLLSQYGYDYDDLTLDDGAMSWLDAFSSTELEALTRRGGNDPKALLAQHMDRLR